MGELFPFNKNVNNLTKIAVVFINIQIVHVGASSVFSKQKQVQVINISIILLKGSTT